MTQLVQHQPLLSFKLTTVKQQVAARDLNKALYVAVVVDSFFDQQCSLITAVLIVHLLDLQASIRRPRQN